MADYFLSYRGRDRALARLLAEGLAGAGLDLWWDRELVAGGRTWTQQLEEALGGCHGYLILVGDEGVTGWVRAEVEWALGRWALDPEGTRIVPLLAPGVDRGEIGGFLRSFQAIPLADDITGRASDYFAGLIADIEVRTPDEVLPAAADAECPFPGLEPFDEARARYYFGRDRVIREAVGRLGRRPGEGHGRWLQIEGPSGSGKSSLARAGVIPALRRGWAVDAPEEWRVAPFRPGRDPVLNLATAVHQALSGESPGLTAIEAALAEGGPALSRLLRERLAMEEQGVLILADQLEEAFSPALAGAAARLDELLAEALEDGDLPLYLITTVRSDFLGQYRALPRLEAMQNERAALYRVPAMDAAALRAAAEGPERLAGLRWGTDLVGRIVDDALKAARPVDNEAEKAADEQAFSGGVLPLVGHVLKALWERRERPTATLTHDAYRALGYLSGALSSGADELLGGLGEAREAAARQLLVALVRIGRGTADSRKVIARHEALAATGLPEADALALLGALSGARAEDEPANRPAPLRLLVADERGVTLIHDALISHWRSLRGWVGEERRALERRDDLEAAARTWREAGAHAADLPSGTQLQYLREARSTNRKAVDYLAMAERRARRRLWLRGGTVVGLVVVAVGMAGLALEAERQRSFAEQRLKDALEVAERVVFRINRDLKPIAGTAEIRRSLLDDANDLLEKLQAGAGEDPELLFNRAAQHDERGQLALSHDDLMLAETEFRAAHVIMERLVALEPERHQWLRHLSVSFEKLGDVAAAAGDLEGARKAFEQRLKIVRRLVEANPGNVRWQRDLSVSFERLGGVALAAGNLDEAREAYEQSQEVFQMLADADSGNTGRLRDLSVSFERLGDVAMAVGDLERAREVYGQGQEIFQRLADADPGNTEWQRGLSVGFTKLGDVAAAEGDLEGTREAFEQGLTIIRRLADADPGNARWQRDLSVSLNRLGDVAVAGGDLEGAGEAFEQSLGISRRLADADPSNARWQRDLSVSFSRLGNVAVAAGDLEGAREAFEQDLQIAHRLAEADPGNAGWQRDLSVSYNNLGDVAVAAGDLEGAREAFEQGLVIGQRLADADPDNVGWQRDLAISHERLASIAQLGGDWVAATVAQGRAVQIKQALVTTHPDHPKLVKSLLIGRMRLLRMQQEAGEPEGRWRGELVLARALLERLDAAGAFREDAVVARIRMLLDGLSTAPEGRSEGG